MLYNKISSFAINILGQITFNIFMENKSLDNPGYYEPRLDFQLDTTTPHSVFILSNIKGCNKVLDIGCNVGYFAKPISELGIEYVGIDNSPACIEHAKQRYSQAQFIEGDAEYLLNFFQKKSFDGIIASEVIEHVINPERFLLGIYEVLKPNGKLILTSQNSNGIQLRIRALLGRYRWDRTHFRLYSKVELTSDVASAGFKVKKSIVIPFSKKGQGGIFRLAAHYFSKIFKNAGWTIGIMAERD